MTPEGALITVRPRWLSWRFHSDGTDVDLVFQPHVSISNVCTSHHFISNTTFSLSAEEATGLYEQSSQACHEVWKGDLGIQTYSEGSPKKQSQDDFDCFQLPSLEKI